MSDFNEAVAYLHSLADMERFLAGPQARTMSLAAMRALLSRLGNPEQGRNTVHVAGSKGKGSTSVFINAMLAACGQSTMLYTSPHLHDYRERIVIGSEPVSPALFASTLAEIMPAIAAETTGPRGPVSTFGALTAMFFQLARATEASWQVVEVGLGGRDDATNVFASKDAAVLTAISREHSAILGDSLAAIASHKAGIIPGASAAIMAPQLSAKARAVIRESCLNAGVRLIDVASSYRFGPGEIDANGQTFWIETSSGKVTARLSMLGQHQIANAATAIATLETLAESHRQLSVETGIQGLSSAVLPGRMEQVAAQPPVFLDGAHNNDSAQALRNAIDTHVGRPCTFIVGMNRDKDVEEFLAPLLPVCHRLIVTASNNEKAISPEEMERSARKAGARAERASDIASALSAALDSSHVPVVVTGSLYLVGEARARLLGENPPWSLRRTTESRVAVE